MSIRSTKLLGIPFALTLVAVATSGCYRQEQCPPPPPPTECPVCECPSPTPPPTPTYTGPTTEEWMHLPTRILFPSGGDILDEEARRLLQEAVVTLRGRTDIIRIRVEGHTDRRGADASNAQLSLQRAQAVVQHLVSLGVPSAMLEAQGYGDSRPVTSDATAMDREQNRRVEFSILVRRPVGGTP